MSPMEEISQPCEDQLDQLDEQALKEGRKWRFVWHNVFFFSVNHILSMYGIYLVFTKASWYTILFAYFLSKISVVGVTAGAHRLWSHRSYKVNLPLKLLILLMYTVAYQGSVHQWVRDHRVHHKHSDTEADPHNAKRGFFFSHIGWLLLKKSPEVANKGRSIDLSDIDNDPVLSFQKRHYFKLVFLLTVVIPSCVPLLWQEDFWTSFIVAVILRHTYAVHMILFINSAAHMWGTRPYDKDIYPRENLGVSLVAGGEGFHNFHHAFPWDCKAAELGGYWFNTSWLFINMMSKIGWAYDLKFVSEELIEKRAMRTGDGTHAVYEWDQNKHID